MVKRKGRKDNPISIWKVVLKINEKRVPQLRGTRKRQILAFLLIRPYGQQLHRLLSVFFGYLIAHNLKLLLLLMVAVLWVTVGLTLIAQGKALLFCVPHVMDAKSL